MDVRQLKYFVTIVDASSLSKASERLFIAQPSLSQQILNLERDLGVQLLVRSRQGVVPTEAGKTLYRLARDVLRGIDQIRKEVKDVVGTESGKVSIGLTTTVASIIAAPLFRRVQKNFPAIRLQIYESVSARINELLIEGRLDLAILFREVESSGVSGQPLFHENFYIVGHQIPTFDASGSLCPLRLLSTVPIVAPGPANGMRLLLERAFAQANAELNIVADIDSLPTMTDIAESGDACIVLSASALMGCRFEKRPPIKKIVEPELTRLASLCWNNSIPTLAATDVVRATIIDLIAELHEQGKWIGITPLHPNAKADPT